MAENRTEDNVDGRDAAERVKEQNLSSEVSPGAQPKGPNEYDQTDNAVIAQRTGALDGVPAPEDGRFRRYFTVTARDWDTENADFSEMHEANKVATLQEALNRGLHPTGEARYDGDDRSENGRSVRLTYSVDVVPAGRDSDPARAYTPAKALEDLPGGSTMGEHRADPLRTNYVDKPATKGSGLTGEGILERDAGSTPASEPRSGGKLPASEPVKAADKPVKGSKS